MLHKVVRQSRRILNLGSLFGSPVPSALPYDRIAGHPVFSVTTPYGSPYMTMEKLSDLEEVVSEPESSNANANPSSISEEQNEYRTVALYFMDPDDATALSAEMKQMDQMAKTDLRLTSCSLSKAVRQASNFGKGLPTGMPAEASTGEFTKDGSLRYKIVPAKRQLYYAARCRGKERVGLFGEAAGEDALLSIMGNSAIEATNLQRRREARERKSAPKRTALQQSAAHMEGYTGIPVFYSPAMHKSQPRLKRWLTGHKAQIPLFFNYEDLQEAWKTMATSSTKKKLPAEPENVEVFNLWDVLTSMDKHRHAAKLKSNVKDSVRQAVRQRVGAVAPPDLQDVIFVPSSRAVHTKEAIRARGNGKARLRPMR